MAKKWTYEDIYTYIKSLGYKLISKNGVSYTEPLVFEDSEGYLYHARINNLKKGRVPDKFNIFNHNTIKNIRLWLSINNKNFELISNEYSGNKTKLQWKCLNHNCKELFESDWSHIYSHKACPYCSGRRVSASNCLMTNNSILAKEWHPTKNGDTTPYDVTVGSSMRVWWMCDKGHEWEATVNQRSHGNIGCPYCCNRRVDNSNCLDTTHKELMKQWDYSKNTISPHDVTYGMNHNIWWECYKGHKWNASISNRTRGYGCPYCGGRYSTPENNLSTSNPSIIIDWDYLKNKKAPIDYTPNSGNKVWWKCSKCTYEWYARINSRSSGTGCPCCCGLVASEENNLFKSNPSLCSEWNYNANLLHPEKYTPYSGIKVWWICSKCDYEWKASVHHRNKGTGCPKCNESQAENKISQYLKENLIEFKSQYKFTDCKNKRTLPFDFAILNKDSRVIGLIEANGKQHYEPVEFFGGDDKFILQQKNDSIKIEYCNANKIPLTTIPYWDFDNIESILAKELQPLLNQQITQISC